MPDKAGIVKADFQIHRLSQSAKILFELFFEMKAVIGAGSSGIEVQNFILEYLAQRGTESALRGYRGFQADVSISVNSVAAHGIPNGEAFKPGDLVTVDCVVLYKGWYGDMAWTYGIPPLNLRGRRLIAGSLAVLPGWLPCIEIGNINGHSGEPDHQQCPKIGGRVVNEFCGHSIGRELHETPIIPYIPQPGWGWKVEKGMVLNIEPVVTLGDPSVILSADKMAYSTVDGQPTAQYELTCAVDDAGMCILSLPGLAIEDMLEYPPFF